LSSLTQIKRALSSGNQAAVNAALSQL
jgi:hypothetical protein